MSPREMAVAFGILLALVVIVALVVRRRRDKRILQPPRGDGSRPVENDQPGSRTP